MANPASKYKSEICLAEVSESEPQLTIKVGQVTNLQFQEMPGQISPLTGENVISGIEQVHVGYVKSKQVGPNHKDVFQIVGTWKGPAIATDEATLNGLPFAVRVRNHFGGLIAALNSPGAIIPERLNPSNAVNFKAFPPEIRNSIYEYHLKLGQPVNMVNGLHDDRLFSVMAHIRSCRHGTHTCLSQQESHALNFGHLRQRMHCQEAFKPYTVPIDVPRSRLDLLLADKQIYEEAVGIFYQVNDLRFEDLTDALEAIQLMGTRRANSIRTLSFKFKSYKASTGYPRLHALVPNLENLGLMMSYSDTEVLTRGTHSLSSATGIKALSTAFTNLTTLSLHGVDRIKLANGQLQVCDVNDAKAIGPWLREKMIRKTPVVIEEEQEHEAEKTAKGKKSKTKRARK